MKKQENVFLKLPVIRERLCVKVKPALSVNVVSKICVLQVVNVVLKNKKPYVEKDVALTVNVRQRVNVVAKDRPARIHAVQLINPSAVMENVLLTAIKRTHVLLPMCVQEKHVVLKGVHHISVGKSVVLMILFV
jgi:hypothetical protein